MSNKHPKYLSKKKVRSIKCDYLLLLGERSNGKSYCAKTIAVEDAIKNKKSTEVEQELLRVLKKNGLLKEGVNV